MSLSSVQLPVMVEVPVDHKTFRPISDRLRERLDVSPASAEEVAAESQRASARSARLRVAHLESVKERAQRDIQRAEEAAARKVCQPVSIPRPLRYRLAALGLASPAR